MAAQQILFAETIAGMKKAFKRKAYESDSDEEIESLTNRGHKLQKRGRFAHSGQLMPTSGPSAYTETVDYAGVRRSIIYRNPPLVDDEGYEVDSEDNGERVENAELAAAELNPYTNVHIEQILAPLTASTDLPDHPTLSKPFTSKTLNELVSQSCDIMRRENQSLWQVRHIWTSLCGDGVWMPCKIMLGANDIDFFSDEHLERYLQSRPKYDSGSNGDAFHKGRDDSTAESRELGATASFKTDGDVNMADTASATENADGSRRTEAERSADDQQLNRADADEKTTNTLTGDDQSNNADTKSPPAAGVEGANSLLAIVSTGGQAHTNSVGAESSEDAAPPFIHPMFLPPADARLDRDMGLPTNEAEDIRRLLALYVQKQEEVCRGASKLHHGLLRAERLRQDVLHWSKAEAHSGPNRDMSDGEDWYDKEEWGLINDLKKGQDEEEEDTATTGKKTRSRRA